MPSKKISLLLLFATLLVMAMLVEPSVGRELMKKKKGSKKKGSKNKGSKNKGSKNKGSSKTPSAPAGTGISAAMIQSQGYVLVGKSVYDISSFRHPGGTIINTCKGKDCTSVFNANHNAGALSKASRYKVGTYGK